MVKVGFPDKVTGLWAFERQMPFQKYQGSAIVVRYELLLAWNKKKAVWQDVIFLGKPYNLNLRSFGFFSGACESA